MYIRTAALLTLLITFISGSISAQSPVITEANFAPLIGEDFEIVGSEYVSPGLPGENITWDLSTMSGVGSTLTWIDPGTTPYAADMPSATICYEFEGLYDYYESTPTEWSRVGGVSGAGVVLPYSDKQVQLVFPMQYGTTFTDSFEAFYSVLGVPYHRYGTITATADGYGKVILPYGTLNNVLRVSYVEDYRDDIDVGGTTVTVNYESDVVAWYQPDASQPVAASTILMTDFGTTTGSSYLTESSVTTGLSEISQISIQLFPNPAISTVNVQFELYDGANVGISVSDLQGRILKQLTPQHLSPGSHSVQLNVAELSAGVYMINFQADEQRSSSILHIQ